MLWLPLDSKQEKLHVSLCIQGQKLYIKSAIIYTLLSGFEPGSTPSVQSRCQPTFLSVLRWSIMPSDGQVHPQKIDQVYIMCMHSHHSIYHSTGQATVMKST